MVVTLGFHVQNDLLDSLWIQKINDKVAMCLSLWLLKKVSKVTWKTYLGRNSVHFSLYIGWNTKDTTI